MAVLLLLAQHVDVLLSPSSRSTCMVGGSFGDLLPLCDMFDGFVTKKSKSEERRSVTGTRCPAVDDTAETPRGLRESYRALCGMDVRRRMATDEVHVTSNIVSSVRRCLLYTSPSPRDS